MAPGRNPGFGETSQHPDIFDPELTTIKPLEDQPDGPPLFTYFPTGPDSGFIVLTPAALNRYKDESIPPPERPVSVPEIADGLIALGAIDEQYRESCIRALNADEHFVRAPAIRGNIYVLKDKYVARDTDDDGEFEFIVEKIPLPQACFEFVEEVGTIEQLQTQIAEVTQVFETLQENFPAILGGTLGLVLVIRLIRIVLERKYGKGKIVESTTARSLEDRYEPVQTPEEQAMRDRQRAREDEAEAIRERRQTRHRMVAELGLLSSEQLADRLLRALVETERGQNGFGSLDDDLDMILEKDDKAKLEGPTTTITPSPVSRFLDFLKGFSPKK